MLGIFISLLVLSLLVQIMATVFVFVDDIRYKLAKEQWHAMSDDAKGQFESDNDCSGFEQCYDVMEDKLKSHFTIIGAISIGLFVYQLGLLCFTCFLCRNLPDNHHYARVNY